MTTSNRVSIYAVSIKSKIKNAMVYILLVLMLLMAEIFSPGYLNLTHFMGILRLASFMGIAAIGQTFALLTGGIDLSISTTISFSYVLAAQVMMGQDSSILPALGCVLILGLIVGIINGAGICLLNIPPFIMTLGVGSIIRGAYMVFTKGAPKGSSAPLISAISNQTIFGNMYGIVIIWIVLAVITILLMKKTTYGRRIYAVGSNVKASKFSGINTRAIIFSVYIISAVVSAIMGYLLIGYTGMSYLHVGDNYSTNVIAAVIIGGTSIVGGKGGYLGSAAGAVMMTVLEDFLTIVNIPEAGRMMAQGALILLLLMMYAREKITRAC